ncbi:MAG: hypothetical protein KDB03_06875 [Planctomycetales bacterium]|nr:hypothetical protein [Planctomycetales bacterium]
MKRNLILTFTCPDRPGIVEAVARQVNLFGGNWEESRSARLCGDFAGIARVTVAEETHQALIEALQRIDLPEFSIQVKSTNSLAPLIDGTSTFQLACSGADHEGIVTQIASYLSRCGANLLEMETSIEPAPTTGTPIFTMHCELSLPSGFPREELVARLRELETELDVDLTLDGSAV